MTKNSGNTVLITRPIEDADDFAREVRGLGLNPLVEPMLGIVPVDYKMPDLKIYPAIVFTSANGVRVFGCPPGMADILVFAVGAHTAEEVRKHGYHKIFTAEGDANDLAALINKKLLSPVRILHIRGEHTAMQLDELLKHDRITLDSVVVYTARSEDQFSPVCRDAIAKGTLEAVTFFSRRTAENFVHLIEKEGLSAKLSGIKALCISPSVLECVQGTHWAGAYSARQPERAAMLDLLKAHCVSKN
ncbi:MAG: uroporphyrinogen-III synthase [Alphaproteobacteria bacterium PRO2]|nr:uroporphyrinogen-III synthase [Alphaproteobacteria bacterium PRO2]